MLARPPMPGLHAARHAHAHPQPQLTPARDAAHHAARTRARARARTHARSHAPTRSPTHTIDGKDEKVEALIDAGADPNGEHKFCGMYFSQAGGIGARCGGHTLNFLPRITPRLQSTQNTTPGTPRSFTPSEGATTRPSSYLSARGRTCTGGKRTARPGRRSSTLRAWAGTFKSYRN